MNAPANERSGAWRWALLATLPALLLLAWQVAFVWPFFSDDAFISLRYSERLLAGHGLTWTDGERVEGYSNLLWVLLCAGLSALGLDLVTAARALGLAATAIGLGAIARAADPRDGRSAVAASLPALLAASTQVLLGWTCGGLEGPLAFACLAVAGATLARGLAATDAAPRRAFVRASVPLALLCWTRPDGALWVAAIAAAIALTTVRVGLGAAVRVALAIGIGPALAVLAQLAFRFWYYRDMVPNTAHVKASFDPATWPAGFAYVTAGVAAHAGLVAIAAVAFAWLAMARHTRALAVALALPAFVWLAYLVLIGGDHFPGRRLLHGAIAPLALLAAGVAATRTRWFWWALAPLLVVGTAWNTHLARHDGQSLELRGETWEWHGREVGTALRAAFGDRNPLLAVDAAGAIPFYSGLRALDLLGLCDRTIATTPEPAWLATTLPGIPKPPGHLRGNGRYVLERAPDLFVFGPPPGRPLPVFVSGVELEEEARFRADHRLVVVDLGARETTPGRREPIAMQLWVHARGVCGIATTPTSTVIPAWLFGAFQLQQPLQRRYQPLPDDAAVAAAYARQRDELVQWLQQPPSRAVPDAQGRLYASLTAATATLRLPLAAGRYRAAIEPAEAGITVQLAGAASGEPRGEFVVSTAGEHDLQLHVADGTPRPVRCDTVTLTRIGD